MQRLFSTAETRSSCFAAWSTQATRACRCGPATPFPRPPSTQHRPALRRLAGRPPETGFRNDMLLASTSTAGGLTGSWSKPSLVNPPNDKAAFTAAIAVNTRGQVGVTYYDLTPTLRNHSVLLTDTWFTATEGPGLDFGPRQLIGGPFNMEAAPNADGFFTGDYEASRRGYPTARRATSRGGPDDLRRGVRPLSSRAAAPTTAAWPRAAWTGARVGPDSTDAFSVARPGLEDQPKLVLDRCLFPSLLSNQSVGLRKLATSQAGVAQLVERDLPKVEVVGSTTVFPPLPKPGHRPGFGTARAGTRFVRF